MIRRISLLLVVCVGFSAPSFAQVARGTILGTVTDESRALLPGVTLTLTSPALPGGPSTVVTDEQGRYRFVDLPPGTYTLTAILSGFKNYTEELRVTTGSHVERNVSLSVGNIAETITVTGQSPMVDTRNATVAATATLEVIENLPTNRHSVYDYAAVLPGAAAFIPGEVQTSATIYGSPAADNALIIDGIMSTSPRTGGTWSGGDVDGINEVQISAVGPSAEFPSASAGVINVVTKSGTNTFRGDAAYYWKPDSLQSKPIMLDCGCPDGKTGFTVRNMLDYSVHLGGPIVRDRLWFFGGYNYYRWNYTWPGSYPAESPNAAWHHGNAKVTWQASPSIRVNGAVLPEPWNGYASGPSRQILLEAVGYYPSANILNYKGELQKTFGNATLLSVSVGGFWLPVERYAPLTGDHVTPTRIDNLTGITSQGVPSFYDRFMGRNQQEVKIERYLSRPRMTHNLRFGVQFSGSDATTATAWPSGVQYYDFGGAPDTALFRGASINAASASRRGGWAEDQMTFGDRATLSLGGRYDRVVGGSPDVEAFDNTLTKTGATIEGLGDLYTWNEFSPRVGVNLKLSADGRTVLRSTYARVFREARLNEIEPLHPGIASTTEARYNPATGRYTTIVSVTDPRANLAIDPDLKAPATDTFSLGVDRQLMGQVAVHTSYVYKNTTDLIGWRDIGGVYGQSTTTLPDGRTLTVFPLLNRTSDRLFQRTNPPGWYDTYHGWSASIDKRLSHRWQAQASITLGRSQGIRLEGNGGRDPNDLTNAEGRLNETDRPVIFYANAMYQVPVIDLRASAQYQDVSNRPYAPVASVVLPQGRRNINIEAPGAFRAERVRILFLRLEKSLFERGPRAVDLFVNVNNLLQNKAPSIYYFTFNYFSPSYGEPFAWVQPRHMYVGARMRF
jgi:hypothetical protein